MIVCCVNTPNTMHDRQNPMSIAPRVESKSCAISYLFCTVTTADPKHQREREPRREKTNKETKDDAFIRKKGGERQRWSNDMDAIKGGFPEAGARPDAQKNCQKPPCRSAMQTTSRLPAMSTADSSEHTVRIDAYRRLSLRMRR